MKTYAPWLAALALLAALGGTARAQVKDAATLLPAHTLACVEVRQPQQLAREVAALLKGSALEDLPATLARFRARKNAGDYYFGLYGLSNMAMFLSPEMIRDAGRVRGAVLALTGVSKEHGPEYLAIVQTGDSTFPPVIMRGNLMFSNTRIVSEVEGIPIYCERQRIYKKMTTPGGAPPPPEDLERGPAMAMLPGALVWAATPAQIKDVIRRYKRKTADPSLASVSAYKEAAALRDQPGLFAYADVAALATQLDELSRIPRALWVIDWKRIKALVNPKAVRSATAALTLVDGNLSLRARLQLDPRQKSPLVDLLPTKNANPELFHFVPRGSLVAASFGLNDGEKRWDKLLALADALAKVEGLSDLTLPSKAVREVEDKLGLRIGKMLVSRLAGVALVLDHVPDRKPPSPLLVIQATDAPAANYIEEKALPRLAALVLGGDGAAPKRQTIAGQRITTLGKLPGGKLHVGRAGSVLVIGLDARRVADALTAGGKKEGLLGEAKVAAALKDMEGPVVGTFSLGRAAVDLMHLGQTAATKPAFPGKTPPPPPPPPAGTKPAGKPAAGPAKGPAKPDKWTQDMEKAVAPLPPVAFALVRKPDSLILEFRQTSLRRVVPRVITIAVEAMLERSLGGRGGMRFDIGSTEAAVEVKDDPVKATPKKEKKADKPKKD